jgi:hypothetical protein
MNYIFNVWQEENNEVLNYLYTTLVNISQSYGVNIIENNKSFNYFLHMMYRYSTKEIIPFYDQQIL